MITSQEFYESLQQDEQFVIAHITLDTFLEIDESLKESMYFTVKQQNNKHQEDLILQDYYKRKRNLSKEILKREHFLNYDK
jgi:hypothetical protein